MFELKILIHLATADNPDLAQAVAKQLQEMAEPYPALAEEISVIEVVQMKTEGKELKA